MPLIKSLIELAITPIMFIVIGGAKVVEHYKMVDDMNTNHNQ